MAALDYYRILGVKRTSTMEEVRRRFRQLASLHHPDHNPGDPNATARFRLLVEAFEAIQAARSRAQSRAQAKARNRRAEAQYRKPRFTRKTHIFEEFFGIPQDGPLLFRSAGADFRYDLEIPFIAAIKGMRTVIAVEHRLACRPCGGSGLAPGTNPGRCPDCQGRGRRFGGPGLLRFGPVCPRCQGRGKIVAVPCPHCQGLGSSSHRREYQLRIPPGTHDGARFRIYGEGGQGFHNGPSGNLLVVIHVAPHDFFTRKGNDIHCQVQVSFAEAARGDAIRIPTVDGFQMVNLPPGVQTGWTFRFLGAGAPGSPEQPPGDQVNHLIVGAPPNLSPLPPSFLGDLDRPFWETFERAGHE